MTPTRLWLTLKLARLNFYTIIYHISMQMKSERLSLGFFLLWRWASGEIERFYRIITDHVSQLKCEIDVNRPFTVVGLFKKCVDFFSLSLCLFHFTKLCHFQRTVKYATSDIVCSGLCASVQPTPTRQLFSFVPFFLQFNSKNFAICRKKEKSEWVKLLRQLFCSKYSKTLRKASHYQLNSLRVRSQPFVGESWPRTKTERERHKHEERIIMLKRRTTESAHCMYKLHAEMCNNCREFVDICANNAVWVLCAHSNNSQIKEQQPQHWIESSTQNFMLEWNKKLPSSVANPFVLPLICAVVVFSGRTSYKTE